MSRKQEIYLEILGMVLPLLRNIQGQSRLHRLTSRGFFLDAELVHNLPACLIQAEFTKQDVLWMNTQARMYVEKGNPKNCAFLEEFNILIFELFVLVPDNLRNQLTWVGPKRKQLKTDGNQ